MCRSIPVHGWSTTPHRCEGPRVTSGQCLKHTHAFWYRCLELGSELIAMLPLPCARVLSWPSDGSNLRNLCPCTMHASLRYSIVHGWHPKVLGAHNILLFLPRSFWCTATCLKRLFVHRSLRSYLSQLAWPTTMVDLLCLASTMELVLSPVLSVSDWCTACMLMRRHWISSSLLGAYFEQGSRTSLRQCLCALARSCIATGHALRGKCVPSQCGLQMVPSVRLYEVDRCIPAVAPT